MCLEKKDDSIGLIDTGEMRRKELGEMDNFA